ncbi:chemerin-like receptor 1 [Mustelus asterias]
MDAIDSLPTNSSEAWDGVTADGVDTAMRYFSVVIYVVTFVLGMLGNGLVIWATVFQLKWTVNTVWFLGLALADFTFSLLLPFSAAYLALDYHWPFGTALCKINSGVGVLTMFASVLTLTAISLDRCVSVVMPVWSQNHRRPRLAILVSLALWGMSALLSVPTFLYRDTYTYDETTTCYTNFATMAEEKALETATEEDYDAALEEYESIRTTRFQALAIFRFLLGFLLPFLLIGASYATIGLQLWRKHMAPSGKPFKVIAAIILAFLLCWTPFHTFIFLEVRHPPNLPYSLALKVGIPLSSSLATVNSCLNPILYICMGQGFRDKIKRSLRKILEQALVEDSTVSHATSRARTKSVSLGNEGSTLV